MEMTPIVRATALRTLSKLANEINLNNLNVTRAEPNVPKMILNCVSVKMGGF